MRYRNEKLIKFKYLVNQCILSVTHFLTTYYISLVYF